MTKKEISLKEEYYVYVYLDPRKPGNYKYNNYKFGYEPFYIGKGKNDRCKNGLYDKHKSYKINKINAIKNEALNVIILKLYENMTNKNACLKEIKLIKNIGRYDLNLGPLTNHTDGGDGALGTKHTDAWFLEFGNSVDQYDLNGNFIKNYRSIKEAANQLNLKAQNIGAVISGRYKSSGGYIWCNQGDKIIIPEEKKLNKRTILQFNKNGDFIKEWNTITEATKTTGANNIVACCKGNIRNSGGYVWRYKNIEQLEQGYLNYNINQLNHDGNFNKTKHKPETLEKMKRNKTRAVLQIHNNIIINEFYSISEAHRKTNINSSSIVSCCKNTRKTAGGYSWKYK